MGATGTVTWTMPTALRTADGNTIGPTPPFMAEVVDGQFSIHLPATDNSEIVPLDWAYDVSVRTDVYTDDFQAVLPSSPSSTTFAAMVPLAQPAPTQSFVSTNTVGQAGGPAGPLNTEQLLPAAQIPFGTTAGTVAQGNDARILGALQKANNLQDVDSVVEAQANLGVPAAAGGSASVGTTNPYVPRKDTAANWTSSNPTLAAGEIGIESDTRLAKMGTGSTAWASLPYFWQPYYADPYAQIALFLDMLATNGDPANMQSTPGMPTGILLLCKSFLAAPGPITNVLLDCIAPDTTAALTGLYAGIYDATGPGNTPGSLLGVTADFSATVKTLPGSGEKLSIPLLTGASNKTSQLGLNSKFYWATLVAGQSASPVMTYVGGRNYGTNQAQTSDYRLWRSTATNLPTMPSTAPTGANIEGSNSSYIWMGAN